MSGIADLLNLDGTLTNVAGTDSTTDDFEPVTDESTTAVKCWIEQNRRSENTTNGDRQDDTWSIYLPPGTPCTGSARLTVGDVVLQFDGPPWPAVNPRTTVVEHVEATGRRVQ